MVTTELKGPTELQVPTEGDVLTVNTDDQYSGVLGIYRISLWIIVLTLNIISIISYIT